MSTVRANTVTNAAGTGSPAIAGGELVRSRVNFNGSGTIAIRDAFNVSSLVDQAVGTYQIYYTVVAPDINYMAAGSADTGGVSGTFTTLTGVAGSYVGILVTNDAGAAVDRLTVTQLTVGAKP